MHRPVQHIYKPLHDLRGMLYAWFPSMYTRVDLVLCHRASEEELMLITGQIYDKLQQLEKTANYYSPTSELYNVNQNAYNHPIQISQELYDMIHLSMEYQIKTLGCFDITIQSVNFNKETHHSLSLSPEKGSISFKQAGTQVDLSGMLKGYALEKVRDILRSHEIEDALINMGNSSILALGNHPHGEGWKVGFGAQTISASANEEGVLLRNQCLTTSGNDTNERRHIISPQSGKPIEGCKRLAVVTDNGTVGEVLSTGLFTATPDQRKRIIKQFDLKEIYDLIDQTDE